MSYRGITKHLICAGVFKDRAVKVGKLEHYWRIKAPPAAGAPYDRLSSVLHTKVADVPK